MPIKLNGTTFNNGGTAKFNGTPLKEIKFGSTTVWKKETNLWVDGTTECGTWSTVKNSLDRGQTITFGTTIATTNNTNNNSSHGVLIYPSNKVAVTQGDRIRIDVSRHNEWCVDTNVVTWYFYISILYLSDVPSDFHNEFNINGWVANQTYKHYVQSTAKGGSSGTQTIDANTFEGTVPVTGNYYVCLCIHGYDSVTNNLSLNNFKIV